jgi:excisionase family DNA binding protein
MLLTVDEVTELWHCHRLTVLRLMKRERLHVVKVVDGEPRFDRDEVLRLKNRKIALYPHFTVLKSR